MECWTGILTPFGDRKSAPVAQDGSIPRCREDAPFPVGVSGWRLRRGAIACSPERQGKRPVGVAGILEMPLA